MSGTGLTTAAIISFSENLEERSMAFYTGLAERWVQHREVFVAFAKDGKRNRTQVVRTYQETVSDAYETSYSFEGLDLGTYGADTTLGEDASLIECLEQAVALEERASAFYLDAAERSESLLATIPRAFKRVAKKRGSRKRELEALLSNEQVQRSD